MIKLNNYNYSFIILYIIKQKSEINLFLKLYIIFFKIIYTYLNYSTSPSSLFFVYLFLYLFWLLPSLISSSISEIFALTPLND